MKKKLNTNLGFALGFMPKIVWFWVWILDGFIPNFGGVLDMGLGVGMKPIRKTQTQILLGVNVW